MILGKSTPDRLSSIFSDHKLFSLLSLPKVFRINNKFKCVSWGHEHRKPRNNLTRRTVAVRLTGGRTKYNNKDYIAEITSKSCPAGDMTKAVVCM